MDGVRTLYSGVLRTVLVNYRCNNLHISPYEFKHIPPLFITIILDPRLITYFSLYYHILGTWHSGDPSWPG